MIKQFMQGHPDTEFELFASLGSMAFSEDVHGACRGAVLRIACNGIDGLHAGQAAKQYGHACPGIEDTGWGTREVTVRHSFGNRLTFANAVST